MTLRDAVKEDLPALASVECLCFPDDFWSEQSLASHLADPLTLTCLFSDGERVLGYASGRAIAPEAEVYRVAVLPEARGRGIGTALLRALEVKAGCMGCDRFYLEVRASNAAARRLYEAGGYEEIGVRRRYYRAPVEDAVLYEKVMGEEEPCIS